MQTLPWHECYQIKSNWSMTPSSNYNRLPWLERNMPKTNFLCINPFSGTSYSGVNQLNRTQTPPWQACYQTNSNQSCDTSSNYIRLLWLERNMPKTTFLCINPFPGTSYLGVIQLNRVQTLPWHRWYQIKSNWSSDSVVKLHLASVIGAETAENKFFRT